MSDELEMICPTMGKPCVGVDRCAPAVFAAAREDKATNYQPGVGLPAQRVCPIVLFNETVFMAAGTMTVGLIGEPITDHIDEDEDDDDATMRDRVIGGLHLERSEKPQE